MALEGLDFEAIIEGEGEGEQKRLMKERLSAHQSSESNSYTLTSGQFTKGVSV
jgi:hypothetical protein